MTAQEAAEVPLVVTIRRGLTNWVIVEGSHEIKTPWRESADAISVVTWVKTNTGGKTKVRVEV
jgi:hypothetical protein